MIDILSFKENYKKEWDYIVLNADNSHFMFMRDYMEYHKDRFDDASFLILKDKKPVAVLPGNKKKGLWNSHGGLTFGGLLLLPRYNRITFISKIYDLFFKHLKEIGYTSALIKPLPWIYHKYPCEGEVYILNCSGKKEHWIEVTTTVTLPDHPVVSSLRRRMKKKALREGLKVQECKSYTDFWSILSSRLEKKYRILPVHTCEEIETLAKKFPFNIRLFCVFEQSQNCIGGSVIFVTDTLWHAQYISANDMGMELGALDLLFDNLIQKAQEDGKRYFDFGISTENKGQYLNDNLTLFKEGFGGRSVIHQKILVEV